MKLAALFVLTSLVLSSCAQKVSVSPSAVGQWIPVGESKDNDVISVDSINFVNSEESAKVWVRIDHQQPPTPRRNATQSYVSFNCREGTFQTHHEVYLGNMGEKLKDKSVNMQPTKVRDASTENLVLQKVCFDKKQPKNESQS
jgi:hypothetical protein